MGQHSPTRPTTPERQARCPWHAPHHLAVGPCTRHQAARMGHVQKRPDAMQLAAVLTLAYIATACFCGDPHTHAGFSVSSVCDLVQLRHQLPISSATICLIVSAGRRPSVRSAGFVVSVPTNTIVGSPWICGRRKRGMLVSVPQLHSWHDVGETATPP